MNPCPAYQNCSNEVCHPSRLKSVLLKCCETINSYTPRPVYYLKASGVLSAQWCCWQLCYLWILFFSTRAPSMKATSSFVSHRFESWEKLQNSHIPFISCCVICVFASVWDCFLLFCEYKENTEKKPCGSFGRSCRSCFIKKSKVEIFVIRWPLAGTHSSTKLNEWAICSFLTMDLRGWIPFARCCT